MASVRYRVGLDRRREHLYDIEVRFPASPRPLDVWLPVWTPGSYLVREFARHLQELRAFDGTTREPLPVGRLDKCTWRIGTPAGGETVLQYRVFARELSVRTSHLDETHGFFNGANLFVTSDAFRTAPCSVELVLPEGWRSFCALPERDGALHARDYDELVDSPVELGPHSVLDFTAAGKRHEVVIWGAGHHDAARLKRDLSAICDAEASLFGGLPFERYLFIVHLTDQGRGGLEHAASTVLLFPRFHFKPKGRYEEFLSLAAHEYFHLWNVKRVRPKALVPFDYRREMHTELLWAMEGITSYYDTLMLRRAGLIDARRTLERFGEAITTIESQPGQRIQSLAESSFLAWIKHYRPDDNSPNSAVSYYVKGKVVALLLDLHLRVATDGSRSLDDLMRLLLERHGAEGVPEDGVEAAALELGGPSLAPFLANAIHGVAELDYSILDRAGLVLRRRSKRGPGDKGGVPDGDEDSRGWLGAEVKGGERALVSTVYTGSPAAQAGLSAEDELIAFDGFRVTASSLNERLQERHPGERVQLTLFRRDQLREVSVLLGERPATACYLEKRADADAPPKSALRGLARRAVRQPVIRPSQPGTGSGVWTFTRASGFARRTLAR